MRAETNVPDVLAIFQDLEGCPQQVFSSLRAGHQPQGVCEGRRALASPDFSVPGFCICFHLLYMPPSSQPEMLLMADHA